MYRKDAAFLEKKLQKLHNQGKIEEMYEVSKILYDNSNEPHNVASALYYQAYYKFSIGEYEECLFDCTRGEEICIKNNLFELLTYINNLQGVTYSDLGDFLTSLNYLLKAYYLTLDHPEYEYHYVIVNNLGTLFHEIDCDEKGIEYYMKAYHERREYKKEIDINDGIILANVLMAYYKLNREDSAEYWLDIFKYYFWNNEHTAIKECKIILELYYHLHRNNIKQFIHCLYEFIKESGNTTDYRNTIKNYTDCIKNCIKLNLKKQAYDLYHNLEAKFVNSLNLSRLAEIKVELAMKFCSKEELHDQLLDYYHLNMKAKEKDKLSKLQSLLNKIDLENALYEQHIILKKNEELVKSSKLDAFTEVLNKKAFQLHVEEKIKEKDIDKKGAFFIIDIDNFKSVNDTCGHLIGDHVIVKIASVLRKNIRKNDLIGRVGGDEFCIYLDDIASLEDVNKKAYFILKLIRDMHIDGLCVPLTISMGACIVEADNNFDKIYKNADLALYQAKENGRNQFIVSS